MAFDPKLLYSWHKFAEKNGGEISLRARDESKDIENCTIRFDYNDFPIVIVFGKSKNKKIKTYTKVVSPFVNPDKSVFQIHYNDALISVASVLMKNKKIGSHRIFSKDEELIEFLKSHFAFNRLIDAQVPLEIITTNKPNKKEGHFPFDTSDKKQDYIYFYAANLLIGDPAYLELLMVLFFDLQTKYGKTGE